MTFKESIRSFKKAIKDLEQETGEEAVTFRRSYMQLKNTFEGCILGQTPNIDAKQAWKQLYNEPLPKVAVPTANFKNLEAGEVAAGMTIVNMGVEMVKGHVFMTKFAEQLADRYEAIDKPMLMRSLSRLFQVQKSVLTAATDLESKAKALAKDEGFAMLFATGKEEFLEAVQLVESKIGRIQSEVEMLQGGSMTSAFEELMNEGMKLQAGAKDCTTLKMRECRKRYDCKYVNPGETYINKDGEEVKVKKGLCRANKLSKMEQKQRKIQGVYFAILVVIASYLVYSNYSLSAFWELLSSHDEAAANLNEFWGYWFSALLIGTIFWKFVAAKAVLATGIGFVQSMFSTGIVSHYGGKGVGEQVKEWTLLRADYALAIPKILFITELGVGIFIALFACAEFLSFYGPHNFIENVSIDLPYKPKANRFIGPFVAALVQYNNIHEKTLINPFWGAIMSIMMGYFVYLMPHLWSSNLYAKCFGAKDRQNITKAIKSRRQLGTSKKKKAKDNNQPLQLQDKARQCACNLRTLGRRCNNKPKEGELYCWRHMKNRNNCFADDEQKTGN